MIDYAVEITCATILFGLMVYSLFGFVSELDMYTSVVDADERCSFGLRLLLSV